MKTSMQMYFLICLSLYLQLQSLGSLAGAMPHADPGERGDHAVAHHEYHYGDTACVFEPETNTLRCSDMPCGTVPARDVPLPLDTPKSFYVELTAAVHYPAILHARHEPVTPYPLVIFLHGGHISCYDGTEVDYRWPCAPMHPIPSYRGFDYLAEVLASHGYIVVSISANGIKVAEKKVPGVHETTGMIARVKLIQKHLNIWKVFNGPDNCRPFGDLFHHRVALRNIGLMGHSLGGQGVIAYYCYQYGACQASQALTGTEPLARDLSNDIPIKAIFTIAPYYHLSSLTITRVPFAVMLPYCDGDLKNLPGVFYFDKVWYDEDGGYNAADDSSPRHMMLVMGANHNYYNTVWTPGLFLAGTMDDWVGRAAWFSRKTPDPDGDDPYCGSVAYRLTAAQQRGTGIAYITGFFRAYLGHESEFMPILTGDSPPPLSAMTKHVFVSYHAPHPAHTSGCDTSNATVMSRDAKRLDINRLLHSGNATQNTLCDKSESHGVDLVFHDRKHQQEDGNYPERTSLSKFRISWTNTSDTGDGPWYRNDIPPAYRDVHGFQRLQFRAGVDLFGNDPVDPSKPLAAVQDFSVELYDGTRTAAVFVCDVYRLYHDSPCPLYYPPGPSPIEPHNPKVMLNMISVPLGAFRDKHRFSGAEAELDLTNIQSVTFRFNHQNKRYGMLLISNIAFSK